MSAAGSACAGLGLFFIGLRLLSGHLRDLVSGRLRRTLSRWLGRVGAAPLVGVVGGALTQSTSAVTFIATGLVTARVLTLVDAVPLLAWANVGTSALVLMAVFDARVLALYLLGLIGLAFLFGLDQAQRYRHAVFALLGYGLLIVGLGFIKDAVSAVEGQPVVLEMVAFSASGPGVALLCGYVLAIVLQSSSIVTALSLPLVSAGLVELPTMALLILGACAGSGSAVVLVTSGMDGPSRQLALTQGLLRGLGAAALLPLVLYGDAVWVGLAAESGVTVPFQVALLFLGVQLVGVLLGSSFRRPVVAVAERLAPPAPFESDATPRYLSESALAEPEGALSLVRLEHLRLIQALPDFLEDLREQHERAQDALPLHARIAASAALLAATEQFLMDLARQHPGGAIEGVFTARRRLADFSAMQKALGRFALALAAVPGHERPQFACSLVEGLHALLVVVAEACGDADRDARSLVQTLTAEHGGLADQVRRELLNSADGLRGSDRMLDAALQVERLLWVLRERAPLPDDVVS